MTFLRYSFLSATLALGLFVVAPAFASASTLYVDVNVQNTSNNNNDDRDPNDFTVEVWGNDVSPESFKGTSSGKGKKVTLDEGSYSVRINNTFGYTPSYSSGCSGSIDDNDTENCVVTLRGSNNYYPPNYSQPCQGSCAPVNYNPPCQSACAPTTYYTQPVITKGYVPYMPSTGFEPQNGTAYALAGVVLMALGLLLYPYVRKVFTVVLR